MYAQNAHALTYTHIKKYMKYSMQYAISLHTLHMHTLTHTHTRAQSYERISKLIINAYRCSVYWLNIYVRVSVCVGVCAYV